MKKRLIKLLSYLKDGYFLDLEEDTFLTGKELDGSDKIYGFKRIDGQLIVVSRQGDFDIDYIEKDDLRYIFKTSEPDISDRIRNQFYTIKTI